MCVGRVESVRSSPAGPNQIERVRAKSVGSVGSHGLLAQMREGVRKEKKGTNSKSLFLYNFYLKPNGLGLNHFFLYCLDRKQ